MKKNTISMAIFKFANCKRLPGRVTTIMMDMGVSGHGGDLAYKLY